MKKDRYSKYEIFSMLHKQNNSTLILPNAWDTMSAKLYEMSGFKCLGTTSAGMSLSNGYQDGQHVSAEKMLEDAGSIIKSVDIPVSVDFESGFGESRERDEIIHHIQKLKDMGVVGVNIEDSVKKNNDRLYDIDEQARKIEEIKKYTIDTKQPIFINARTDTFWLKLPKEPSDMLKETIERIVAFEVAGADCVFIPGLFNLEEIIKVRESVSCHINLLAGASLPRIEELSKIGIERESCGSSLYRSTLTHLKEMSDELRESNELKFLTHEILPYGTVSSFIDN